MGEGRSFQVLVIFSGFVSLIAGGSISCHFEEDLCDWHPSTKYNYAWKKSDEPTKDRTSGPLSDHTFSNKTDGTIGYYIYSSGWDAGQERNLTASITSKQVNLQGEANFTFWYYMNGRNIGNLSLSTLKPSGDKEVIWSTAGSQGRAWKQGSVNLGESDDNSTFKLQFSSTSPYRPTGSDIALDDFLLSTENPKPVTGHTRRNIGAITTPTPTEAILQSGSCSFEQNACGYVSAGLNGSQLKWLISSKKISSIPESDGHYAYTDNNNVNVHTNEESSFVSPVLSGGPCVSLSLSYIFPYYKSTTLRINILKENSRISLRNVTNINMKSWTITENIPFIIDNNTKLEFIAKKVGYSSYVGLDTIQIRKSKACTSRQNIYCYFDNSTCGFNQTFPVTKHWIWGDSETGPTIDITTGTGKYFYFNFNKSSTDKTALLTSPEFDGLSYKCFLIRFNTTSSKPSVLSIYLSTTSQGHAVVPQWTLGAKHTMFGQIEINLPPHTRNRVILEGRVTADNDGYFMIDDMYLLTKECKEKPKCTPNVCLNQGTCVESIDEFICLCRSGYTGELCETSEQVTTTKPIVPTTGTTTSARTTIGTNVSPRATSGIPFSARTIATSFSRRTTSGTHRETTGIPFSARTIGTSFSRRTTSGVTSEVPFSSRIATDTIEVDTTSTFTDRSVSTFTDDLLSTSFISRPSTTSVSPYSESRSPETVTSVTTLSTISTTGRNETKNRFDASLSQAEKTSLIVAGSLIAAIGLVIIVAIIKKRQNTRGDLLDDTYEGTRMDIVGKTPTNTPNNVLVINIHKL